MRKIATTAANNDTQEAPVVLAQDTDEAFANLASFLEEMGDSSSAHVSVYRDVKGSATGKYLFRCTPSEFSLADVMDKLRDDYTGGSFRVVVHANGVRVKNQLVEVEAPVKSSLSFLDRQSQQPAAPVSAQNDLAGAILAMSESMRAGQDALRDAMMQQQHENTKMLLDLFKETRGGKGPENSIMDIVTVLGALQKINPPKDESSGEKLIDMYFKGMEVGRDMASDGGGSVLSEAIKAFGPTIAELTGRMSQVPAAGQPMAPRPGLPKGIAPAPQLPAEKVQPIADNSAAMQQAAPYIQMLMTAAMSDADAEIYANLVLDQVPELVVREWLESDVKFEMVIGYLPPQAMAELRPWFDTVREMVLELLKLDDNSGELDATGGGEHGQDVPRGTGSEIPEDGD